MSSRGKLSQESLLELAGCSDIARELERMVKDDAVGKSGVSEALAPLWAWVYFEGFNEPDAVPPALPDDWAARNRFAIHIRTVLVELERWADQGVKMQALEVDNERLRADVESCKRELLRLRTFIAQRLGPDPWESSSGKT